ncbi:MAG TPA: c-type cytochrome [Gaiellaceae bacterium]|nr:c-type cytochrome [Gaiellaceae bacterium]
MLVAITTEGKIGLGVAAGLFILFALAVSFWFPRRNPDFPGERLGAFVGVSLLLFLVTVGAVFVFAKEEEGHGGTQAAETHGGTDTHGGETEPETEPAETEPAGTGGGTETGGGTDTGGGEPEGDAEAGAEVFAANGCGGCHTFQDAGSSGNVGPNLDEADVDYEEALEVITEGRGAMPAFGDRLDEQQLRDVAAYVTEE